MPTLSFEPKPGQRREERRQEADRPPSGPPAAVDATTDPRIVLEHAAVLAQAVRALRAKRSGVPQKRRERIGERDGWVCCICGKPVDKTLQYDRGEPRNPAYDTYLAGLTPRDMPQIVEWVAGDTGRARAVSHARHTEAWWLPYREGPRRHQVLYEKHIVPLIEAYGARNDLTPSVEHLVPVSVGGTNEDANLAIAHRHCNVRFGNVDGVPAPNQIKIHAALASTNLIADATDLLNGDPVSARRMRDCLNRVCALLESLGRGAEIPDGLREVFPAALEALIEPHRERWAAEEAARRAESERQAQEYVLALRVAQQEEVCAALDAKLAGLKRSDAIERCKTERTKQRRRLGRIKSQLRAVRAAAPAAPPANVEAVPAPR